VDAEVVALQSFGDVLGVIGDFFADGADFHLHRREPQRKAPGVVLDQDAEEALNGAEQRAWTIKGDAWRRRRRRIAGRSAGQVEVELYGVSCQERPMASMSFTSIFRP